MHSSFFFGLAVLLLFATPESLSAQQPEGKGRDARERFKPGDARKSFTKPRPAPNPNPNKRTRRHERRDRREKKSSRWILFVALIVGGLTLLYHVLPARRLPEKKPRLSFFPKYRFELPLPESVHTAAEPLSDLARLLAEHGFAQTDVTQARAVFSRGSVWGQSIEKGLLRLTFRVPLASPASVEAKAGWIIGFDTGDLWRFCSSLHERLAEADPSQPT